MASFIESLRQDPQKRDRLLAAVFLLGIFTTLPIPSTGKSVSWLFALTLLWASSGALAWSAYFKPAWTAALWLASFFIASFLFWKFELLVPATLLLLWAFWQGFRAKRVDTRLGLVALILIAGFARAQEAPGAPMPTSNPPAPAPANPAPVEVTPAPPAAVEAPAGRPADLVITPDVDADKAKREQQKRDDENKLLAPPKDVKLNKVQKKKRNQAIEEFRRSREELKKSVPKASEQKKEDKITGPVAPRPDQIVAPKYMLGYTMNDITSCAVIDRVPWKFRPDQRKTRLLIKDYFRFQSQTEFYTWEFYQLMDKGGFISYVIRRPISSGRYESFIVKDTAYNRVIEDPKHGNKVVEQQDLKTLVNRETLVFYHANGSTIAYVPSSIGNSVLTIAQTSQTGRQLAPIYLRSSICDRPDDISDEDSTQKKILTNRQQSTGGQATTPAGTPK